MNVIIKRAIDELQAAVREQDRLSNARDYLASEIATLESRLLLATGAVRVANGELKAALRDEAPE